MNREIDLIDLQLSAVRREIATARGYAMEVMEIRHERLRKSRLAACNRVYAARTRRLIPE
jgi:hypothetical protein